MRTIAIPYGRKKIHAEIDEERLLSVLESAKCEKTGDEREIVRRAFENPIVSPPVHVLAVGKRRILVITSDHTRPVPSRITMPIFLSQLRRGAQDAEIVILIATGVHRETTRAELCAKFGEEIVRRERIVVHRAEQQEKMAHMGTLPSGGALYLNDLILWADLVVAEGFIEPHFFAGFSGGRKSILPGIASKQTVLYNHNARFIADPKATQGMLSGNPIHRDMVYAAQKAGLAFILNVILDAEKRIVAAFAGDMQAAHEQGCAACEALAGVSGSVADIVITSNGGYPLDQNIYQAVKGMTSAERCVRPGGVIIMCAEVSDGHGGEAFYRWFESHKTPDAIWREIENVSSAATGMDQWQAQILSRVLKKAACVFVTEKENKPLVEAMHMRYANTLPEALAIAGKICGQRAKITVIPDGVGVIVRCENIL